MDYAKVVGADVEKKKALYLLGNMRLKGYVSEHSTNGLYWFNTEDGLKEDKRDLLVSATDVKVII
jgi:hypothetical protein